MKFSDYTFLALASLKERRGRTLGAVLGVIIAVVALSLALGVGESFQIAFREQMEKTLAANSIYIFSSIGLTEADLAYYRNIYEVEDAFGITFETIKLVDPSGVKTVTLVAIEPKWLPEFLGVTSLEDLIEEGSYEMSGLGVIVGSDVWKDPQTGQKLRNVGETLTVQVSVGKAKQITFYIIGLAKETGGIRGPGMNPDNSIYVEPEAFFTYIAKRRVYNLVVVVAKDSRYVSNVEKEVRALSPPHARVFSPAAMINQVSIFVTALQTILGVVSSVGIGVTALWVFDSMTISVIQRTREIGILKAIGFKSRDILLLFLMEAAVISIIGSISGVAIAMFLSSLVRIPVFGYTLKATITPSITLLSIALPILANLVASLLPARRAASLDPVRALRYE
ncbi:MAG: hypothetical protein DRJ38_05055 [Thermoprotei archaeon]|nr:MAG: hypothetical protein DRJ38_05055 [Thermoprotei archaeon]